MHISTYNPDFADAYNLVYAFNNGQSFTKNVNYTRFLNVLAHLNDAHAPEFIAYAKNNKQYAIIFHYTFIALESTNPQDYEESLAGDQANLKILFHNAVRSPEHAKLAEHFFEKYAGLTSNRDDESALNPSFWTPQKYQADKAMALRLIKSHEKYAKNFATLLRDDSFVEEAVTVNLKVMEHLNSSKTGKIELMRRLIKINPMAAQYACAPITTKAGVKKEDGKVSRQQKVHFWLTSTKEHKLLKSKGMIVAQPKSSSQTKTFKI